MTIYAFTPGLGSPPFSFQPTLDGEVCTVSTFWNTDAQRWYVSVVDLSGNQLCYVPLVGSPTAVNVAEMGWSQGIVTLVTEDIHGWQVGADVSIAVTGCSPDGFNGTFPSYVVDPYTIQYPVQQNPGPPNTLGAAGYIVNLIGSFFSSSILYYLPEALQFVVLP